MRKSATKVIIGAMHELAATVQSGDGVANLAIAEAAERIEELEKAYHEAINRPKGVVPNDYEYLYDQTFYDKD